jgi:large subunit ribosomal protein L15
MKMVVHIRERHRKFRGRRTYHGSHKKWRGGGSRGGRGAAGYHKHKWSYTVKYDKEHFGKITNKSHKKKLAIVGLGYLDSKAETFLKEKIAEKEGDSIKINVAKLGYEKVLGSGKVTLPLIIEAKAFSKSAEQKLAKAGGKAVKVE